ncbi:carbohydrate ABC transporter substrate-binding protein [Alginatibacterium sediminis]|uniref:Probable sugar-binding periplasmic protein n=1 Tax=Alginatibacterium sediminis TaxID=2164068 RepID=A0A420EG87_9ALTE|nr:ABC transporter substrate-binding protein [Alginatibacterium sediminis]RKF19680.1 carbohydrate ABC transporter substrate-binding protein [Alginatibacterium sediminis]
MKIMDKSFSISMLTAALMTSGLANAVDLEVTHWWTSGGEAAAVAEFAKAFDENTSHKWVDGAIAGSGGTARPIIISRILGGKPMGATQLNHGRQAEELIEEGLLLDITDVAMADGWKDVVNPSSLLDSCTLDGKIYCVPVNIHSWEWIWLSHQAYEDAGVAVPSNWEEFVAAAPALEKAGKIPLAMGQQAWQRSGAFGVMSIAIAGIDAWKAVNIDKDAAVAAGPEYKKVFDAAVNARAMAANSKVQDWNQATNMVITGQAGGQIMGDWAQGEFQVAGQVAGEDYTCLPGLGANEVISTGGDAFYFPKQDDPEVTKAQKELASLMMSQAVQVAFNLKKGSLPVRGDIELDTANDCMKKGLKILADGNVLPSGDMLLSADTQGQLEDLMVEFWSDTSYSAEDAQKRYAAIIGSAD